MSADFRDVASVEGGASFAMECGIPCELIQAQGDWRSDARTGPISTRPLVIGSVWHTLWGRRSRVRILLVLLWYFVSIARYGFIRLRIE